LLGAVQDAEDDHGILHNSVGNDKRRAEDDEFTHPLRPARTTDLRKLRQVERLFANTIINTDGGSRVVCFDLIKDSVAVFGRRRGPHDAHRSSSYFAGGGSTAFGEVGFDLLVRNGGPGVVEGFLHFGAEPFVVSFAGLKQFERERAFVGGAGEQDADGVGDGDTQLSEHLGRAFLYGWIDARLHQCGFRHEAGLLGQL
jgi:hypothetical protein